METEEIIKKLRRRAVKKTADSPTQTGNAAAGPEKKSIFQEIAFIWTSVAVIIGVMITCFIVLESQKRAENVSEELDPNQVKGLTMQQTFNPNQDITYVQISEGQDRNVAVSNLGTTLPIISRFNYKALTPENFQIIGSAPWALTTNISSNLEDADMIKILLANNNMIQAFLIRDDASSLLDDPQNLAAFVRNERAMKNFFTDDTTVKVVQNPVLLNAVMNSRFMSFLLISESAKYFRTHPQEAAELIKNSSFLRELQINPNVQQAVRANRYLSPIAEVLLTPKPVEQGAQINNTSGAVQKTKKTASKKKKKA